MTDFAPAAAAPGPALTLGPTPVVLTAPSMAERWAVEFALVDVAGRTDLAALVFAAALGLACKPLRAFLPKWRGDVREFGAATIDYLLGLPEDRRPTMAEIMTAGRAARKLCEAAAVTEEMVRAAEDFSPPPPAASTASAATSTAGVGWTPVPSTI